MGSLSTHSKLIKNHLFFRTPDSFLMLFSVPIGTSFAPWSGTGKLFLVIGEYQMQCLAPLRFTKHPAEINSNINSLFFIKI